MHSGLEGDRVTDLCGTARLGGQVCPREVWLHVQTVSFDDGQFDQGVYIFNQANFKKNPGHVCLASYVM